MRTLEVKGILAHKDITINFNNGTTLITGKNAQGKSSLAQIIAALTAHDGNPKGYSKAYTGNYLHHGDKHAIATLSDGATWQPPGDVAVPSGMVPEALPHTVGLMGLGAGGLCFYPGKAKKEMARCYEDIFMPDDPEQLLRDYWGARNPDLLDSVIEAVKKGDWDVAFKTFDTNRTQCQRKWQEITGKPRYGVNEAEKYQPDGWHVELETASDESLSTIVSGISEKLENTKFQEAVDEAKIIEGIRVRDEVLPAKRGELAGLNTEVGRIEGEIKPLTDKVEDLREQATTAKGKVKDHDDGIQKIRDNAAAVFQKAIDTAQGKVDEVKAKIEAVTIPDIPEPMKDDGTPCPHCGKPLKAIGGEIKAHTASDNQAEIIEATEKAEAAKAARQKITDEELRPAEHALDAAVEAKSTGGEPPEIAQMIKDRDAAQTEFERIVANGKAASDEEKAKQAELTEARRKLHTLEGEITTLEERAKDADLVAIKSNEAEINRLTQQLDDAKRDQRVWRQYHNAMREHKSAVDYKEICDILGPTGCRREVMQKAVTEINEALAKICEITGWDPIHIKEDYQSFSNDLPAYGASDSEKIKVNTAIGIAIAMLRDDVKWLLVDAADTLKDESWDGLVAVLDRLATKMEKDQREFHSVVFATSTETPEGWDCHTL